MDTANFHKWTRLASYQLKLAENVVRCNLCPHNCMLHAGQSGICRTRVNIDGDLYTLSYANPCSVALDPIEKKPLFHFYPGSMVYSMATEGCNFRCLNCQNWKISQSATSGSQNHEMLPADIVKHAKQRNASSIAFTYTEPTVFYEYLFDTARLARENGIKTVLVSNGYINEEPLFDLCQYLDAANIDLKCFDDAMYRKLTGGELQPVLDSLKILRNNGVWLEITNLIIPGWTDNMDMIRAMCEWLVKNNLEDTPLHFSRFFPVYKLSDLSPTLSEQLIQAAEIARECGINYVYIGNVHDLNGENTYCKYCKHLLIERNRFEVVRNEIKTGCCDFCGEKVDGNWE